jgi:hypothetical protein
LKTFKRAIVALATVATLGGGAVALTATPVAAHNWGGQGSAPAHTHQGSCAYTGTINPTTWNDLTCVRYILANGAIIQGPKSLMDSQYGYVLVWCSFAYRTASGSGRWAGNGQPYGPWNNTFTHPYCQNPKYQQDILRPWSITYP